jgi:hypothetical protein
MPKPPPDTRWNGTTHWFALANACSLAGLTKAKLTALGDSGKVQMVVDEATGELWFERLEILALREARMARKREWQERNPEGAKRRPTWQLGMVQPGAATRQYQLFVRYVRFGRCLAGIAVHRQAAIDRNQPRPRSVDQ